ncbi:MAG: acetyl-CoA C-acetyltransferase, partial [Pseudomonadota bacterium]
MSSDPIVVVAAKRTPIGSFQGSLSAATAVELGTTAARGALEACDLDPAAVEEVYFGCVLPAGLGQAPARYAALGAGIPDSTGCVTVNKMCGSGMKTVQIGHDLLRAGSAKIILAGGLESMSNAPYLLPKARAGYRMGHQQVVDHMFFDGLQNVADGNMMGLFGEQTSQKYGFTREAQDSFAIESVNRALRAIESGVFS